MKAYRYASKLWYPVHTKHDLEVHTNTYKYSIISLDKIPQNLSVFVVRIWRIPSQTKPRRNVLDLVQS